MRSIGVIAIALAIGIMSSSTALCADGEAMESSNVQQVVPGRFGLGIAGGAMRFNSSYRLQRGSGLPIFVSGEGTLGLDETVLVPIFYGEWNITPRHALGFHYFGVDREGSALAVNQEFGSLSVDGLLQARDESSFYYLNYSYAFVADEDRFFRGTLGVYAVDLEFAFDAFGEIAIDDNPVTSGMYSDKVSQLAPLPMLGVQYANKWTERWLLAARFLFIGGEVNDLSGIIVDVSFAARYNLMKNAGLILGFSYFDADIDIRDGSKSQDIAYGYDGIFAGLDFRF